MIFSAGLLWVVAAIVGNQLGVSHETMQIAVTHNLEEFAELFLFLLVAMIYINALEERNIFEALKGYLINRGFNYQQLFWVTSGIAFVLSPVADNLTTALIMGAVVMAVGVIVRSLSLRLVSLLLWLRMRVALSLHLETLPP
ncbi:Na+/H+ antiporter nhaD type [Vibrio ishigakensis]|uniref:Na+/H+ antiporter nhaD type n=1 Tax=Vibrio ishigakensis TaxID=1481914 RepID=A0A0B8P3Q9_9VIBR|nr:Na+/H+ antiporter nhaD type [Vibrio ishigakensis]